MSTQLSYSLLHTLTLLRTESIMTLYHEGNHTISLLLYASVTGRLFSRNCWSSKKSRRYFSLVIRFHFFDILTIYAENIIYYNSKEWRKYKSIFKQWESLFSTSEKNQRSNNCWITYKNTKNRGERRKVVFNSERTFPFLWF